ncbi:MAG TPA: VOC family protein [Gemmatimonadaceae bacterium]|nr:VOC family protein [Gemmatimonadaceae bacterium]
MTQSLAHISLVVREYDEAIAWFSQKLGFVVLEDSPREDRKRFVRVAPAGSHQGASLLLARAATADQESRIGNQTGGRVFLFLHTDDFDADYERMVSRGVTFTESPRSEEYGRVVVFKDLYGNKWDLIERMPLAPDRSTAIDQ